MRFDLVTSQAHLHRENPQSTGYNDTQPQWISRRKAISNYLLPEHQLLAHARHGGTATI